jgi:hypothetical protein
MPKRLPLLVLAAAIALSGCVAGYVGPRGAVVYPGPIVDTRDDAPAAEPAP